MNLQKNMMAEPNHHHFKKIPYHKPTINTHTHTHIPFFSTTTTTKHMDIKSAFSILEDIKNTCKLILTSPLLKEVSSSSQTKSKTIERITNSDPSITRKDVQLRLIDLTRLARKCSQELVFFEESLHNGELFFQCPFLESVWTGDQYGAGKQQGLKALLKELKGDASNIHPSSQFIENILDDKKKV